MTELSEAAAPALADQYTLPPGCDFAQHLWWSKAVPEDEFWLTIWPEPKIPLKSGWRWQLTAKVWELHNDGFGPRSGNQVLPGTTPKTNALVDLRWVPIEEGDTPDA